MDASNCADCTYEYRQGSPGVRKGLGPILGLLVAVGLCLPGCAPKPKPFTSRVYKPVPYSGPAFLRNTVGASAYIPKRDFDPLLVSNYGLVVHLAATGSNKVPPQLRERILTMARKGRLGSAKYGTEYMTPERVLADTNTAVVAVEALIPSGASKGTRFDLLVSTIPRTGVSSLAGGRLWQTKLSQLGVVSSRMYNRPRANGSGPLYVNPFVSIRPDAQESRQAVVVGGGIATEDRIIELVLRQPSYALARAIADRINERFPKAVGRFRGDPDEDDNEVATAKTDNSVRISIPKRFQRNPHRLLNLITHLYLGGGPDFEYEKAHELGELLLAEPQYAEQIVPAWEALGKMALPVMRERYYEHPKVHVCLGALEAGAKLGDLKATGALERLARHPDWMVRRKAADLLGYLSQHVRTPRILRALLDDRNRMVRLEAYESLATIRDPLVQRTEFRGEGGFKFMLDLVPSTRPLIYISHEPVTRVVIFDPMLGFENDALITMWDDRLMLRRDGEHDMRVYFEKPGQASDQELPEIRPTVANLVYLLAHNPTIEHPMPGFDFEFGEVANVLHTLCRNHHIPAPLELQMNPLAERLAQYRQAATIGPRPDLGPPETVESGEAGGNNDLSNRPNPRRNPRNTPRERPRTEPDSEPILSGLLNR